MINSPRNQLLHSADSVTREFRNTLKPSIDSCGNARTSPQRDRYGDLTGKYITLLEVTGTQLENYIMSVKTLCEEKTGDDFSPVIIDCSYLYVLGSVKLNGAVSRIDFTGTIFYDDIVVENAIFSRWVDFSYTKFCDEVTFKNTQFIGLSQFVNTNFLNTVKFDTVIFNEVDFTTAIYSKFESPYFINTKFLGKACFRNTLFYHSPVLNDTSFIDSVPLEFAKFLNMNTRYFILEQKIHKNIAAQDMAKNWFIVTASAIHGMISGHGQNIFRPLLWLSIVFVVFAFIFSDSDIVSIDKNNNFTKWGNYDIAGWGYSLQNIDPVSTLFKPANLFTLILGDIESFLSLIIILLWVGALVNWLQQKDIAAVRNYDWD